MPALSDHDRPRLRRVGHKGADLIAPGNTLESFDAALEHGVDMIEFDVLREREPRAGSGGRLILAHDYEAARRRPVLTLEEGLSHFAADAYAGVELDVDLKLPGYEREVVEALQRFGLADRALVSSQYLSSLDRVRALEPALRLGWSVPRARRDYTDSRLWAVPALTGLALLRRLMPRRAAAGIRAGRYDAVMAHWRLVTPALVAAVRSAGGDLFAWTVDDAARIRSLGMLGVTGVITNDPRLFDSDDAGDDRAA